MEKFYWDPDREDVINIVWQVRSVCACWIVGVRWACHTVFQSWHDWEVLFRVLTTCQQLITCAGRLLTAIQAPLQHKGWVFGLAGHSDADTLTPLGGTLHPPPPLPHLCTFSPLPSPPQMYKEDGLSRQDIETLVATFGNQALDFFGALRAATYDGQIRDWMEDVAGERGGG